MTVRGYESDLQSFLRWYESRVLEQLTIADVMNYWRHLGGLKPASINRKLEALRCL
jgi:site-specific recombinase XerD